MPLIERVFLKPIWAINDGRVRKGRGTPLVLFFEQPIVLYPLCS